LNIRFYFAYTIGYLIERGGVMTNIEFCIARRQAERAAFLRVLRALPDGRLDYRPHARSRTAAEIAWTIATEEGDLAMLLETGKVDFKETPPAATLGELVATYERNAAAVDERIARQTPADWEKKGQFLMGGVPVWETTIGEFAWGFLFDAVHHRGQLSAYIRPMGGKVPSIYGPSGDDSGQ
jgi:uncharacterized damage-inducible protein DinB